MSPVSQWSWLKSFGRGDNAISHNSGRCVTLPTIGDVNVAIHVDCRGATCPRPQMLAMKAFCCLAAGEVMEIFSDNPSSVESMQALALVLNAKFLARVHDNGAWRVYLAKDGQA